MTIKNRSQAKPAKETKHREVVLRKPVLNEALIPPQVSHQTISKKFTTDTFAKKGNYVA